MHKFVCVFVCTVCTQVCVCVLVCMCTQLTIVMNYFAQSLLHLVTVVWPLASLPRRGRTPHLTVSLLRYCQSTMPLYHKCPSLQPVCPYGSPVTYNSCGTSPTNRRSRKRDPGEIGRTERKSGKRENRESRDEVRAEGEARRGREGNRERARANTRPKGRIGAKDRRRRRREGEGERWVRSAGWWKQ